MRRLLNYSSVFLLALLVCYLVACGDMTGPYRGVNPPLPTDSQPARK